MSAAAAAASEKTETVTIVFGKEFDGDSLFAPLPSDEERGEGDLAGRQLSEAAQASGEEPFAKVPVGQVARGTSLLSSALASAPAVAATRGNVATANVKLSLQVSVKGADGSRSFISVTVDRRASIADVIGSVLAAPTTNIVFTTTDPSAYTLMIADADGEPDEDFAVALGADQPVLKFKSKYFALARKERKEEEGADQAKNKFVEAPQYETTDAIKDFRVLKVHMPDASYMHLPYPDETTPLNKLLITICEKRSLPATEYSLFDGGTQSELDMDLPVGTGLGIIRLVRKPDAAGIALQATAPQSQVGSGSPSLARARASIRSSKSDSKGSINSVQRNASGPLFFLTPAVAAQYKTFPVVKVNKYGVKQFRIMGIDATSITNFKSALDAEDPDGQASEDDSGGGSLRRDSRAKAFLSMRGLRRSPSTTGKGEANTKRPSRPIEDILEVAYDFSRKANAFSIRYKDKEIHYESKLADEIVAKIEMLLQMRKNPTISVV